MADRRPSGAAVSPLLSGLAAYWALEEASGTRADATGRGNGLTDNNTVTQAAGKVGNAAQFVRLNSEYLSHADSADLSAGDVDFTLAAWVYLDSLQADANVISKYNGVDGQREYVLHYSSARFRFEVNKDGLASAEGSVSEPAITPAVVATWYFLCAWHDSVGNSINIQVNNGAVNSVAWPNGVFDGTAAFLVGGRNNGTFALWDGRIDETGLWKRVLTGAEKTSLYNAGAGRTYPFSGA